MRTKEKDSSETVGEKIPHRFIHSERKYCLNEFFTPIEARFVLDHWGRFNRPLNRGKVKQYASDLMTGRWHSEDGNLIKFARTGELLDGRHRLTACAETGVQFTTDVVVGLRPEALLTQDIGKSRPPYINPTLFEAMKTGKVPEKVYFSHRRFAQSIARLMLANENGKGWISPSELELEDKIMKDAEVISLASMGGSLRWMRRPGPRAAIALYAKRDKVKAIQFRDKLFGDGSGFTSGDPILLLRNKLSNISTGGNTTQEDLRYTIDAIHCFHAGLTKKRLSLKMNWEVK